MRRRREMQAERRLGRPSRIYEVIREAFCGLCSDWIRLEIIRAHVEREHPRARTVPETWAKFEGAYAEREVPLPDRICELIAVGNYLEDAAGACGVDEATVHRWASIGAEWLEAEQRAEEVPPERVAYRDFRVSLAHARADSVARRVRRIERAGETDWKADAWILERMHPDRFGRQERLRIGGDAGALPIRVVQETRDPDFIADVVRIYEDAGVIPGVDSGQSQNGQEPGGG